MRREKSTSHHRDRVIEQIAHEIGWVIANDIRDPRVPPIVTVTEVQLCNDKRHAYVYVSIFGDEKQRKSAIIALNNASPFIQKLLANRITLKYLPKLQFKIDRSIEQGQHINDLLKEVNDDLI